MKLSAALLAAFFRTNEANLSCTNGKNLFEATCNSDGFLIKINQACRAEGFAGIDFPNSFVWGDQSVTTLVNPDCTAGACTYADVTSTGTGTCSAVKPLTGMQDSDSADTHSWTVPLDQCGVTGTFDATNNWWKYDLYFNSNSVGDPTNNIVQMNQVHFTCTLKSFQQDSAAITINDATLVANPNDYVINLRDQVELTISKKPGTEIVNSVAGPLDPTQPMVAGMTAATESQIGDHVELRLAEKSGETPFSSFTMSLVKCWASKDAKLSTAGEETISATNTPLELKLWDKFCPLYDWVAPESDATTGSGYLKKHWNRETSIHAINFRQFAFLTSDFNFGDSMYYHCYIKVCPKDQEATCSKTDLTNVANTCAAPTYYDATPLRKKRDTPFTHGRSDLDGSTSFEIVKQMKTQDVAPEDCKTIDGHVCITKKDERATNDSTNTDDDSSAMTHLAGTSLVAFIALLNL